MVDTRNYFIFDGISSLHFDAYINGKGVFDSPDPDYSVQEVPGMNGDLHLNNNRYKNVSGKYEAFILRDFKDNFTALKTMLLSRNKYCRLEDTYFPGQFRLARVKSKLEPDMVDSLVAGTFTVEFDCKPQRFLKSGERPIEFTTSGSKLLNKWMPAKPLVKVYGSGSGALTFGGRTINISSIDSYVMLDCETQNAYKETSNKNSTVSISRYPELLNGENIISWTGGITKVEITPRWWVL